MDPVKSSTQPGQHTQFPSDSDIKSLNAFFTNLDLNKLVATSECNNTTNRLQRAFTYAGPNNNNNNNNNIPDPTNEADDATDTDLEIIDEIDEICDGRFDEFIKIFKERDWLIELPNDSTGNTPLLSAVMLFKKRPECQDSMIECMAALLALGAKKDVVNFKGVSPLRAALDTKNEFLKDLFTSEAPITKEFLLELAKKHNNNSLQISLELSPVMRRFVVAAADFLERLERDKTNIYQRVRAFYAQFPEIIRETNPATHNTILHDAVKNYTKGKTLGIIEVVVLLEMGADLHVKNRDGVSPLTLAETSGNIILKDLLSAKKPRISALHYIALQHVNVDKELASWLSSMKIAD